MNQMQFPSWREFTKNLSELEKKVNEKITEFKDNHPLLDKAIQKIIPMLPPPFDKIAEQIYSSFEGTVQEKSDAVLNYFKYLQSQGENHYNKIASQLNSILINLDDIKLNKAKESTLQQIQEILISNGNTTIQKLDLLRNQIVLITGKLDKMQSDIGKPIEELGEAFGYFKEEDWSDWRFRSGFLKHCEEVELNDKLIEMIIAIALEDHHWINRMNATNLLGRNLEKFLQIKETLQTIAKNDDDWRIKDDASNWIKGMPSKSQLQGLSTKKEDQEIASKLSHMTKEFK